MLVATVKFPFVATENRTPWWLAGAAVRSTMLTTSTTRERGTDAWMGDEDVAEVLPGTGRLEGGVVETLRGESPDDPRVGRDGSVGPGHLSSGGSRYAPRPPAPHKLDPYTGIIDARLEEYPGLSAQRLFDEVRAAGYPGGYSRVRDYVRAVRPREPTESVVRFETPAGRQGQVDFATSPCPGAAGTPWWWC